MFVNYTHLLYNCGNEFVAIKIFMAKNINILVTRLQNIGDTLVFIPALRTLREAFPNAHITFLGKHFGGLEIMKNCPYIDDTLIIRKRGILEKLRLFLEFRKRKIDYFIISPQDLGKVPWAWIGGAKKIVGYKSVFNHGKWRKEKLTRLLDISPDYNLEKTEIENCLELVLKVLEDSKVTIPDFFNKELEYSWFSDNDLKTSKVLLENIGVKGEFIVSSPFSKRIAKNWGCNQSPLKRDFQLKLPIPPLRRLFEKMIQEWKMPVVLLGGKPEQQMAEKLAKDVGENCFSLSGKTSLQECAIIIKKASFFFGPDSGPAFFASAEKTPAVVLYGPADFKRWRVLESPVPRIDIFHKKDCNPCDFQVCPKEKTCMHEITFNEVWEACKKTKLGS